MMKTIRRHWHLLSEKYTGGDSLMTALHAGWKIHRLLYSEDFQRRGGVVRVYYLELERGEQKIEMAVVSNPYVTNLVTLLLHSDKRATANRMTVPTI